jgi:hypothetical protein
MAKQAGIGIAKGAIGLAGLPGDAAGLLKKGVDWVSDKLPEIPTNRVAQFLRDESAKVGPGVASGGHGDMPGSYQVPIRTISRGKLRRSQAPFRKPQNQAEPTRKPQASSCRRRLRGGGGMVRKLVTQDAIPAAASITAGPLLRSKPICEGAGRLCGRRVARGDAFWP